MVFYFAGNLHNCPTAFVFIHDPDCDEAEETHSKKAKNVILAAGGILPPFCVYARRVAAVAAKVRGIWQKSSEKALTIARMIFSARLKGG